MFQIAEDSRVTTGGRRVSSAQFTGVFMYHTRKAEGLPFGLAAAPVFLVLVGLTVLLAPTVWAGIPDETCADCHEEVVAAFSGTSHSKYFADRPAMAEYTCESCHGDATAHVEDADPEAIINPAKHDQFGGSELCLTCHQGAMFDDWMFSDHNTSGLSCASCHKVHTTDLTPATAYGPDLCYTCHADVRAETNLPSHHPIAEGKMSCGDCHNPHGGDAAFAMGSSNRELCFTCHADVEGPFVYEHAPVQEDCMICHSPHGTVADKLLKQNEPALCLNCHAMHFHATVEGWDGDFPVPLVPERAGTSTPEGWKEGMLTKCTQCHSTPHGSDLPSQAASTGGNALTR